jgi:hypothetical protein
MQHHNLWSDNGNATLSVSLGNRSSCL